MEEMSKHGKIGRASMMAGMHRQTGKKYVLSGKLPSQVEIERNWRTRDDPFEEDWPGIKAMLKDAPALEAKALFEWLTKQKPGKYDPGQVRTFQRRVKQWRAMEGPDKEVFFEQEHRPGEAIQTDFTSGNKLGITIDGERFNHLLCHPVLPYSNWEWVTVCRSESFVALKRGVQEAVPQSGSVSPLSFGSVSMPRDTARSSVVHAPSGPSPASISARRTQLLRVFCGIPSSFAVWVML